MIALPFLIPAAEAPAALDLRTVEPGSRRLPTYAARTGALARVIRVRWVEDICDRCFPRDERTGHMPGTSPRKRTKETTQ